MLILGHYKFRVYQVCLITFMKKFQRHDQTLRETLFFQTWYWNSIHCTWKNRITREKWHSTETTEKWWGYISYLGIHTRLLLIHWIQEHQALAHIRPKGRGSNPAAPAHLLLPVGLLHSAGSPQTGPRGPRSAGHNRELNSFEMGPSKNTEF